MRIWLALVVLAACNKPAPPDWKLRTGEGFAVEAPYPPQVMTVPGPDGNLNRAYVFSPPGKEWNIEVLVTDLPAGRDPGQMLQQMHDQLTAKGSAYDERNLAVGVAPAFETRLVTELPDFGKSDMHERVVVYENRVFQVIYAERFGSKLHRADGDRFLETFKVD
jgi:hypothetical protein